MQISPIKNQNFEKPFINPSKRTKVNFLRKIFFWVSLQKNLVPGMLTAQSPRKCSNFKILAKIEG